MRNFEKKQRQKTEERALDTQLSGIIFFSESQESYEKQTGYSVQPISVYDKLTVTFEKKERSHGYTCVALLDVKKRLVAEGVEALVDCAHTRVESVLGTTEVISGTSIKKLK